MLEKQHSSPSFGGVHTVQLSPGLEATYAIDTLMLRPFGINERDLELDFSQPSRPELVTDILECCTTVASGKAADRSLLWQLKVSTRIECLLRIINLDGAFDAALPVRCLNESCLETVEVELSLEELLNLQRDSADSITVVCGEQTVQLRKPSGLDQLAWTSREFVTPQAAIEAMVKTLVVHSDESPAPGNTISLNDNSFSAIDRVMQENDPLVSFSLEVICPYCETNSEFEPDLEALAIERLRQSQRRLLSTVHHLAEHYHWSEQQIFAVPHWRRLHYLKLIDKGRA